MKSNRNAGAAGQRERRAFSEAFKAQAVGWSLSDGPTAPRWRCDTRRRRSSRRIVGCGAKSPSCAKSQLSRKKWRRIQLVIATPLECDELRPCSSASAGALQPIVLRGLALSMRAQAIARLTACSVSTPRGR